MKPVFVILENIGVSITSIPKEKLQVHLVDQREIGLFNMEGLSEASFMGQLRTESTPLAAFDPKPGRKVRLYSHETGNYSSPLTVFAVFYRANIENLILPKDFLPYLASIKDTTTYQEFGFYTDIIRSLFSLAADSRSYLVSFEAVMQKSGFVSAQTFLSWIKELALVGLVEIASNQSIRICNPLIYLAMHSVNQSYPGTFSY